MMKYKVGDKVRIKSIDWYKQMLSIPNKLVWQNKLTNDFVGIWCSSRIFKQSMFGFLGKTMTIQEVGIDFYLMEEDTYGYEFNDEMIEYNVEEDIIDVDNFQDDNEIIDIIDEYVHRLKDNECQINLPEGFEFSDENGNVINATKISLRKKKEVIPNLQLDSIRTVREYDTVHSRIWLEIYEDNPELCIFTHLLVDEDHRQKGYGTKALEQAEIIAKDLGCDTIHLKVKTDSWMHNWYLRSGYKFLTNAEDNYTWLTKII